MDIRQKLESKPHRSMRRKTDAEIRVYRFVHDAPESVEGWTKEKPASSERVTTLVHRYDLPHSPRATHGKVWCCWCQRRNHFLGGVIEFDSGSRRTIGWKCAPEHLGVHIVEQREIFNDEMARSSLLNQYDRFAQIIPEFLDEVTRLQKHPSVAAFMRCRSDLARMQGLNKMLLSAVLHTSGYISVDERLIDYSGTALERETGDGGDETTATGGEARGERVTYYRKRYRIRGAEFVDTRIDLESLLFRARDAATRAARFYAVRETDAIEDEEFFHFRELLSDAVNEAEQAARALHALGVFFEPVHINAVISIRNAQLDNPAYEVSGRGILWTPEDAAPVCVQMPTDYSSPTLRTLSRLRRALAKA
jgi:hypothetical protein